jgi:acetyl/propionyl-CoA carboxylase alpha subunit
VIKRLLVANRGEIAVRVMATAAVLGLETVAVYPADDAACAHVSRAGAAVELPGAGPAAYLDVDAIMAAAASTGCDMLHPGYGFLSERPELARRCAQAGVLVRDRTRSHCSATRPQPGPGPVRSACPC